VTRVDALFDVSYGNKLDMNKMVAADKHTGVAFVGRRGSGEGRSGWSSLYRDCRLTRPA